MGRKGFTLAEMLVVTMLMAVILAGMFALQDGLLQQRGRVLRNIMVRNQCDYARRIIVRELAAASFIEWPLPGNVPAGVASNSGNELVGWKNLDASNMYCDNATGCWPCAPSSACMLFFGSDATACPPGVTPATCPLAISGSGASIWNSMVDDNKNGKTAWADDAEWFRFCYAGGKLYYYHDMAGNAGSGLINLPVTAACGNPYTPKYVGGTQPEVLAPTASVGNMTVTPFRTSNITLPVFARSQMQNTTGGQTLGANNWVTVSFSVLANIKLMSGTQDTAKADSTTGVEIAAANQARTSW